MAAKPVVGIGREERPEDGEARSALARIVTSEAFRNAPQLAAFLSFVVEKALAGEAAEIKGYTIATQALGRGPDFDPQLDPIVRVEAGRLRRALDAYYANAGRDDRLKVRVPRGSYVPVFEREPEAREEAPSPEIAAPEAAVPEAPAPEEPASEVGPVSSAPEPPVAPEIPATRNTSGAAAPAPGALPIPGLLPPPPAEPAPETLDPQRFAPQADGVPAIAASPEIPLAPEPAAGPLPPRWDAAPRPRRRAGFGAPALATLALATGAAVWWALGAAGPGGRPVPPAAVGAIVDGRPVIAVQPLEIAGAAAGGFSPEILRSTVLDALARFDEVALVDAAVAPEARPGVERYALNLRVAAGPSVMARLTHEASGTVVWARRFDGQARLDPQEAVETEIARQIAVTLGQPYGVLFADLAGRPGIPARLRCTLKAYEYWNAPSAERHGEARGCLEAVASAEPRAATAWANLAYFYLDEHRSGFNPRPDPLGRALQAARRALAAAPESPRANQSLMGVYFVRGEIEQALRYGARARELNPFDADVLADVGARYVQAGRYREGAALLGRAAALNPADPPWYNFFLFLAAYMQNDREGAKDAAGRIIGDDYALGLVARAIVAGEEADAARARALAARLVALQPEYGRDPRAALQRRWFVPEIYDRLVEGLAGAGLKG